MKPIKLFVRKILQMIDPDLEFRLVEQFHFNQLKRRPPELMWKVLRSGPEPRLDVGRGQVGHELFIFGGFRWDGSAISTVDVFDMRAEKWTARLPMPPEVAQTHLGVASDGKRYIYLISGQLGGYCLPATKACFVFDTANRSWSRLPDLPKARYAPAVQLWKGRLHSVGGAEEDRNGASKDHWSIAVENGKATEDKWRVEVPIPRGGHHRASAVLNDDLYIFGGQEGDYIPIPGDPQCRCTAELTTEVRNPETYRLKAGAKTWERLADLAITTAHTESSVLVINGKALVVGGDQERVARKDLITLNDQIQLYDPNLDSWKIIGRLPHHLKSSASGYFDGKLYVTTGQRGRLPDDPTPWDRFESFMWKAKLEI